MKMTIYWCSICAQITQMEPKTPRCMFRSKKTGSYTGLKRESHPFESNKCAQTNIAFHDLIMLKTAWAHHLFEQGCFIKNQQLTFRKKHAQASCKRLARLNAGSSEAAALKSRWLKCFLSQLSIILIQITFHGVFVLNKEKYHDSIFGFQKIWSRSRALSKFRQFGAL